MKKAQILKKNLCTVDDVCWLAHAEAKFHIPKNVKFVLRIWRSSPSQSTLPLDQCFSTTVQRHTSVPGDNVSCAVKNDQISLNWSGKITIVE